jgi:hypothetical protein
MSSIKHLDGWRFSYTRAAVATGYVRSFVRVLLYEPLCSDDAPIGVEFVIKSATRTSF